MAKRNDIIHEPLQRELVIQRVIDAPRELVFRAWTESDRLARWWGPKGYNIIVRKFELRTGGIFHYLMRAKDGKEMWGRFTYQEISAPGKIVFINSFSDSAGTLQPAPFLEKFPLEILNTVTLTEKNGKTELKLVATPLHASEEGIEVFESLFPSMNIGYNATFDQLDAFLDNKDASDREIVLNRTLNAPRELVYKAWTDPAHLINWWGPDGFTNTFHEYDIRPGGVWRFIMHGPNGIDYPNKIEFREVVRLERLVFYHGNDNDNEAEKFLVTVQFEDAGMKTNVIMRMIFQTEEERDRIENEYGAIEGNRQTMNRLEEELLKMKGLLITRVYNATAEQVFKAWTVPEEAAEWWGPKGFTNPVCEIDLRPGGRIRIDMKAPDGALYPMHGVFKEIDAPHRIVFISKAFEQENGEYALEALNTVSFIEKNGQTQLTLSAIVLHANEEAREAVKGMNDGWNQMLDKLGDFLQIK